MAQRMCIRVTELNEVLTVARKCAGIARPAEARPGSRTLFGRRLATATAERWPSVSVYREQGCAAVICTLVQDVRHLAMRCYRPRIVSIPLRTTSTCRRVSLPIHSESSLRSRAVIKETLATESFGRPVTLAFNKMLPGAFAHFRLLVRGTQVMVAIRLRFSASHWTTTTGRLKPGPDPVGSPRSAHQTSP